MGIFRNMAARAYNSEINRVIAFLSQLDAEQRSIVLLSGVWRRAMAEVDGVLPSRVSNDGTFDTSLHTYIPTLQGLEQMIKRLNKGAGIGLSIWVYTLHAIYRHPDIQSSVNQMWEELLVGRTHWAAHLNSIYREDVSGGIDKELAEKTYIHARNILDALPPIQLK